MKKKFTLIFLLVFGLITKMIAQSSEDSVVVLHKCIDLPVLQKYYQLKSAEGVKQIYIMQYPVSFSSVPAITQAGKDVYFKKTADIIDNQIEEYFMFRSFKIYQYSASVNCNYFYDYNYTNKQFKMLSINLEMQKSGQDWIISNISIKGDTK